MGGSVRCQTEPAARFAARCARSAQLRNVDNRAREHRPLRELSRRILPVPPAVAAGRGRRLLVRAHGRRPGRRGRCARHGASGGPCRVPKRIGHGQPTRPAAGAPLATSLRPLAHHARATRVAFEPVDRPVECVRARRSQARLPHAQRTARLLPPLREPRRPTAAAPVPREQPAGLAPVRRHLHGAATRQLLARLERRHRAWPPVRPGRRLRETWPRPQRRDGPR